MDEAGDGFAGVWEEEVSLGKPDPLKVSVVSENEPDPYLCWIPERIPTSRFTRVSTLLMSDVLRTTKLE